MTDFHQWCLANADFIPDFIPGLFLAFAGTDSSFQSIKPRRPFLLSPQTRKRRVEVWEKEHDADFLGQCKDEGEGRRELYFSGLCM